MYHANHIIMQYHEKFTHSTLNDPIVWCRFSTKKTFHETTVPHYNEWSKMKCIYIDSIHVHFSYGELWSDFPLSHNNFYVQGFDTAAWLYQIIYMSYLAFTTMTPVFIFNSPRISTLVASLICSDIIPSSNVLQCHKSQWRQGKLHR